MTKEIILSNGKKALVDDCDFAKLSSFNWHYHKGGRYAMRSTYCGFRSNKKILMHREIMGFPDEEIDHQNGNGLDNRRCNLRVCTSAENKANRGPSPSNTSGYKGVRWHKGAKKWMVQTQANGKQIYVGLFVDKVVAAKAYDQTVKEHFGEFAWLNFPDTL